jgi:hypothetical protein
MGHECATLISFLPSFAGEVSRHTRLFLLPSEAGEVPP